MIETFDEDGNGVMDFDEFQTLLNKLEPNISKNKVLDLFKEALATSVDSIHNQQDAIVPLNLATIIMKYKIGGYGREFFDRDLKNKKKKFVENKLAKKGKYWLN